MAKLEDTGLSPRACAILRAEHGRGVTAEELAAMPDSKLLRSANVGRRTLKELRERIPYKGS